MDTIRLEIIAPVIAFISVLVVGVLLVTARERKRRTLRSRLNDAASARLGRSPDKKRLSLLGFLEKVGNFASHGQASTGLWEQLVRAGYLSAGAPALYTGIKMLLFIAVLVAAASLVVPLDMYVGTKIMLVVLSATIVFFVPNVFLSMRMKRRRAEMRRYLPDAIDLLEICVSSGIGLDMAWNIVAEEIQHVSPVLASAMVLANFEMHLGASRIGAMRHMAARTGVAELSSLAAILVQTDRFGSSIASTLRSFAVSMREERMTAAEEDAEKVAVRLILPMALFIFPAVLIVGVGPAIIALARALALGD